IGRDLGQLLDEHRALGLEVLDHVLVVHDLVAHVDRRPVFHQRALDDLDRAHHAGAETARLGQNHLHDNLCIHLLCMILSENRYPLFGIMRQINLCARRPRATGSLTCHQACCTTSIRTSLPSASNTLATIPLASRPATAYIAAGESWS